MLLCFHLSVAKVDKQEQKWQCITFGATSSIKANGCSEHQFGRMQQYQVLGSTRLAVEHAQWKKDLARYLGLRFHAASKVLVDARELAKAKLCELKQNAEFGFDVNPQGSFQKCFKDALTSKGKSFRSAVHATTSRVLCKKESWQE